MQQDGYGHAHQKKAVAEEATQLVAVEGFLDQQGHPQQGKIDPFMVDALFAQKAHQDELCLQLDQS